MEIKMKNNQFENTDRLYEKIKSMGFFERLFGWKTVISMSMDSYNEFKSIDKEINTLNNKCVDLEANIKELKSEIKHAVEDKIKLSNENERLKEDIKKNNKDLQSKENELGKIKESDGKNKEKVSELKQELEILKSKKDDLLEKNKEYEKKIAGLDKVKEQKDKEYADKVTALNSLQKQLDDDRVRIQLERENEISEKLKQMKLTWKSHEANVQEEILRLCKKNAIIYLDKETVPFKGKPDNTIKICDEYIIFDAKSPGTDDLSNFPAYIKAQTEAVKKYVKEKDVKKDIFLVVPTNTLDSIEQFYYNMTDYNVYVLSMDSLEPVMLSLKKIENYEFAEQLSPEDRENICRIIGKFAHATKRRIQVDNYFANEFIEIYSKCESLPKEVLSSAIEFEKSDKLNPPIEKRAKLISETDLKKETKKIRQKAEAEEINIDADLKEIEAIPLYKNKL